MTTIKLSRESVKWLFLESVAIVVGILIAFWVDAWWEERTLNHQRVELIVALRTDFESNIASAIQKQQDIELHLDQLDIFLAMQDSIETVSLDELTDSATPIFRHYTFQPILSTYQSAVNSGDIALIEDREFHAAMATLLGSLHQLNQYSVTMQAVFYHGPIYELTKSVGDLRALRGKSDDVPRRFRLSESRIREIFSSRQVVALASNARTMKINKLNALKIFEAASRRGLQALEN